MIRLYHMLVLAAVAAPASASVVNLGGTYAASCSASAEVRERRSSALADCHKALSEEALPTEDRVATLVNRGILYLRRLDLKAAEADFDAALALSGTLVLNSRDKA